MIGTSNGHGDELVGLAEAANRLCVSERSVHRYIEDGRIRGQGDLVLLCDVVRTTPGERLPKRQIRSLESRFLELSESLDAVGVVLDLQRTALDDAELAGNRPVSDPTARVGIVIVRAPRAFTSMRRPRADTAPRCGGPGDRGQCFSRSRASR